MKKVFSNSLCILSYKFLKKGCAVNYNSCIVFLNQDIGKKVISLKNVYLDTETVPKAVSDPQMIYEAVFMYHVLFKKKINKFGN